MKISLLISLLLTFCAYSNVRYFPKDYSEGRDNFRKLMESKLSYSSKSYTSNYKVPSEVDQDLTVDYGYLKATKTSKNLIIVVSGLHGPESYAGSAVQSMLLTELIDKFNRENTSLLIVHAMNPFGFKYKRRVTEKNVNLNRNFDHSKDLFKTVNKGYPKLEPILNPTNPVRSSFFQAIQTSFTILMKLIKREATFAQLTDAVTNGQFQFEKGIEFGGKDFEPQVVYFKNLFKEKISKYDRVIALDLHTGLGKQEVLHLITAQGSSQNELHFIEEITPKYKGIELTKHSSKGFYRLFGDMINYIKQIVPKESEFAGLTLEYGTLGNQLYSKLESVNILISENQLYHHGSLTDREKNKVKENFVEMFNPSEPSWRESVIDKARVFFTHLAKKIQ
ncbi:M14 family metallopeptidase [bacterium]|nr:M14 family metallopeptidase [bacterium]